MNKFSLLGNRRENVFRNGCMHVIYIIKGWPYPVLSHRITPPLILVITNIHLSQTMSDAMDVSTSHVFLHLWCTYSYYPHFTNGEIKAQRGSVTCPRLKGWNLFSYPKTEASVITNSGITLPLQFEREGERERQGRREGMFCVLCFCFYLFPSTSKKNNNNLKSKCYRMGWEAVGRERTRNKG